jgi:hypothetical protein
MWSGFGFPKFSLTFGLKGVWWGGGHTNDVVHVIGGSRQLHWVGSFYYDKRVCRLQYFRRTVMACNE